MAVTIQELPQVPEWLLALLASHLPFSLPILRRLQFARRYKGGSSPTAHVLLAYDDNDDANSPACFAAAYVDPSRGPETECWLYSTLEDAAADVDAAKDSATAADAVCVEQVLALLRRIRKLEAEYSASSAASSGSSVPSGNHGAESAAAAATSVPPPRPAVSITDGDLPLDFLPTRPSGYIKAGSLHEAVRQAILREEVVVGPTLDKPEGVDWEFNGKWLFRVEDLPGAGGGGTELPAGMRWDAVRDGADVALVQSRTIIPRSEATLLLIPSTLIRLDDGTPIAWVFLGLDGSLTSLHCEEQYRGCGLAKALAARVMRDHLGDFGDDGWCSADVSIRNPQSQGVCRSLGGKQAWTSSW